MQKIAAIFKVRPEEGRLVLLVGLLFLCIQAGQGLGDNAASALFFLRFGVNFLPYMYMLLGATTVILTTAYAAGLGRFARSRFFQALLLGTVGLLAVERVALLKPFSLLYPVIWLTVSCIGMILGTFVWNVAGGVSDARQAKRLFPLYTSAGILGSVVGNFITGLVARWLGTENLLLLFAALLAIAYVLMRNIVASYFPPSTRPSQRSSFWGDMRAGYDFVRGSELMRLIAYASVLFSVIYFAIAFPFNKVVTASFPDAASVAGYLGLFSGIATAVTFLVSLLIANRVYARLGIVNSVLILPLTYLLGFVVFASQYSLAGAVVARFSQLVILQGVADAAWSGLFNVVPSQKRAQVLAFENGLPSQLGVALSGLMLILGERVLTTTQVFLLGIVVTLACGYLIWRMRAAYGNALVDALKAGRLEVFTGEGAAFRGLQNDAAAVQVLTAALKDPRPTTRRLAAEILGRMGTPLAAEAVSGAASDSDASVRAAALAALGGLGGASPSGAIFAGLDDPDAEVRLEALKAISNAPRASWTTAPDFEQRIKKLLTDTSTPVRMQAIAVLARTGHSEAAWASLSIALAQRDAMVRVAALGIFGDVAADLDRNADSAIVVQLLADTLSNVRVAACHALGSLHDPESAQALVTRLHDRDAAVRKAAADALRARGAEVTDFVLNVLDSEFEAARDAALEALLPGSIRDSERLRRFAQAEIERLRRIRTQEASLPPGGRATRLLCESLRHEVRRGEARLVRVVGLVGNPRVMALVQQSLHRGDGEARGAALEALETLGDKALAREIVALLEEEPKRSTPEGAVAGILGSGDRWERALAIRSICELKLGGSSDRLEDLRYDPDPLIAEAADEALMQSSEVQSMNTLQTVSTLERVLLLREIPIFSDLSPEDLQQVAVIATEQWYPANTTIFRQDEEGNMMFVIIAGHVQVVRNANGKEQVLAQRGPGESMGEMAIIESAPRSASLLTREPVRVLVIDGPAFKGILRERPEVSLAVLKSLSRRLREMSG